MTKSLVFIILFFLIANISFVACPMSALLQPTATPAVTATATIGGGGIIAYADVQGNYSNIRLYNVATGEDTLLLSGQTFKFSFSWSPDNKTIFFQTEFHPPLTHISAIGIDGKNLQTVINDPSYRNWMPSISPDGRKIAFCSDRSGEFKIYVMNLDGTGLVQLTDFDSCAPQWSPNGKQIVFHSKVTGNFEIYKINVDGSNLVNLTNNSADNRFPIWSPDGKLIAFESIRENTEKHSDIFTMNSDGTGSVDLTNNPATDDGPSWSPDSNYLAFTSDLGGVFQLYIVNVYHPAPIKLKVVGNVITSPTWSH